MKSLILSLSLVLGCTAAASDQALPKDVEKFVMKREGCDHMRGEIPDPREKARMREVSREISKLCTGTDKQLARLKKKYAANAKVTARLNEFEANIETK